MTLKPPERAVLLFAHCRKLSLLDTLLSMHFPSFHGTFSWPFFLLFFVFFAPWCWYTGQSIKAVLFFEKTSGIIQDATYNPPQEPSSSFSEQPTSRIGTYTHQAVFTTAQGDTRQVFTRVRSNPPPFDRGDRVAVYYNKQNPSEALIGTFLELWLPSLALAFFCFIFFILWIGTWIGPPNVSNHL